jgi:hypothetical protein
VMVEGLTTEVEVKSAHLPKVLLMLMVGPRFKKAHSTFQPSHATPIHQHHPPSTTTNQYLVKLLMSLSVTPVYDSSSKLINPSSAVHYLRPLVANQHKFITRHDCESQRL